MHYILGSLLKIVYIKDNFGEADEGSKVKYYAIPSSLGAVGFSNERRQEYGAGHAAAFLDGFFTPLSSSSMNVRAL